MIFSNFEEQLKCKCFTTLMLLKLHAWDTQQNATPGTKSFNVKHIKFSELSQGWPHKTQDWKTKAPFFLLGHLTFKSPNVLDAV